MVRPSVRRLRVVSPQAARSLRRADLVVVGRVATLGGAHGFGWTDALALRDGRVLAAGPVSEVRAATGPGVPAWRLGSDLVVMPGICDAHLHLASAALAATQPDLTGLDRAAALAAVRSAHLALEASGRTDAWLLGHGWTLDGLGGWPTTDELERAAPGRPTALWAHDHHSRWVSRAALVRAGIDEHTPDPPGGRIARDEAGRPRGTLHEHAAALVDAAIPPLDEEGLERAIRAYAARLAALGVTSVHDPGEVAPDPLLARGPVLYRHLAAGGRLPLRVVASIRHEQLEAARGIGFRTGAGLAEHADAATGRRGYGEGLATRASARYRDGWLKLFADGSLGTRSAALLEPYEAGDPAGAPLGGPQGMALLERRELAALGSRADAAGIRLQVHAIGDAAVRLVLDVLSGMPSRPGAMHRIEHAQLVDPADAPRFARAGVVASVQPCHLLSDASTARLAWGARSARAFPLRTLARRGAHLALGTDAPVEPPDPWPGLAAAVARRGPSWTEGEAFHPDQAVGLALALRAACLGGPRALGVPDEGHLATGSRADLLVVPRDALDGPWWGAGSTEPVRALATARPLATLIDGRAVHVTPGLMLPDEIGRDA